MSSAPADRLPYEDVPLRPFHVRAVISGTGGQFSDGYILGIIGMALSLATEPLGLTSWWIGLLGAASLAGLFFGSLIAGPIADRFGRRPIFAYDMLLFAGISLLQFFVAEAWQLLVLRLILGVTLGADYVVSKALVTEFAPRRLRGRLLSVLAAAWAAGYVCAYAVGYAMHTMGPDAWRWILLSSAVPSVLVFLLRVRIPESPLWLASKGFAQRAQAIVTQHLGPDVAAPLPSMASRSDGLGYRRLMSPPWRRNTLIGMTFYTCQVIPFFAVSTFTPTIMKELGVANAYFAGVIYNGFLMTGTLLGLLVIDRISRRAFLTCSFYIVGATLLVLALWASPSPIMIIALFAIFALVLAAAANLEFVYPPELFPTELRATGVSMTIACSRLGSAASTMLLPVMVETSGIHSALAACAVVTLIGGVACHLWAPETSRTNLADGTPPAGAPADVESAPRRTVVLGSEAGS